jgi:hypothetical protein
MCPQHPSLATSLSKDAQWPWSQSGRWICLGVAPYPGMQLPWEKANSSSQWFRNSFRERKSHLWNLKILISQQVLIKNSTVQSQFRILHAKQTYPFHWVIESLFPLCSILLYQVI